MSRPKVRCRICLSTDELQVGIFGAYGRGCKLAEKIAVLLPVEIVPDDKLPQTICHQCVSRLDEYSDYYSYSMTMERLRSGEQWPLKRKKQQKQDQQQPALPPPPPPPRPQPEPEPFSIPLEASPKVPSITASELDLLTQSPQVQLPNDTFVLSPKASPPKRSESFLDLKTSHRKKKCGKQQQKQQQTIYPTFTVSPRLFD